MHAHGTALRGADAGPRRARSNVYLPAQVADPSLVRLGDVVTVRALWNASNGLPTPPLVYWGAPHTH